MPAAGHPADCLLKGNAFTVPLVEAAFCRPQTLEAMVF
jgi:hypothetical protein